MSVFGVRSTSNAIFLGLFQRQIIKKCLNRVVLKVINETNSTLFEKSHAT